MGLPDLLRRGASARALREGSLIAVPRPVGDAAIADSVACWAPDAHLAADGRFLLGRSLQLLGPLDGAEPPAEALTVYAIVHRRDRTMYEFDADALAAGLARRLDGWYRREAGAEWSRPDPDRHLVLYAPRGLSAGEALALLPPGLLVEHLYEDGYVLRSRDLIVRVGTAESSLVTFPLIARQPWFTGWEHTAEYRVEPRQAAARAQATSAAQLLARACGGVQLDRHGFPWV
jgi:hypothetical protein